VRSATNANPLVVNSQKAPYLEKLTVAAVETFFDRLMRHRTTVPNVAIWTMIDKETRMRINQFYRLYKWAEKEVERNNSCRIQMTSQR
jgi:hypothetical protein